MVPWHTPIVRVVYTGPSLSGKTANVEHLHARIPERGHLTQLLSLPTAGEATLFFDLFGFVRLVKGRPVRVNAFTVVGGPRYHETTELLLAGAHGVVFVADARADRLAENQAALASIEAAVGGTADDPLPIVLQANKCDLPGAAPQATIEALDRRCAPSFTAAAAKGEGVLETLDAIVELAVTRLTSQH